MGWKKTDALAPYQCHGLEFSESTSGNAVADCPLCGKPGHFFVEIKTGRCDCKRCGFSGNTISFLTEYSRLVHKDTAPNFWKELSQLRGLPVETLKRWGLGWDGTEWLLPAFSEKMTVRDIRRWNGTETRSTAGCHVQLYGLHDLAQLPPGGTVWLCEGEWDTISVWHMLNLLDVEGEVAVGLPGATTFKADWVKWFKGHNVISCFDNDDAGDAGAIKAWKLLRSTTQSMRFVHWPDARPKGWDMRDMVVATLKAGEPATKWVKVFNRLLKPQPRHLPAFSPENGAVPPPSKPESKSKTQSAFDKPVIHGNAEEDLPTYADVMKVFKRWLKMDRDLLDCLAITLAVCMSNDVPGDPLWLYIVGPPSSGKTAILNATEQSERVFFRSTLTPGSLVSGFNVNPDPSIIPLMSGRTAVFKDGTELLSLHTNEREKIYSILRGAFDGRVYKNFGNGVVRDYTIRFSMLMGVTPAIHGDNQATMGERFLKFEINENQVDEQSKMLTALDNIGHEDQQEAELRDVVKRFLMRKTGSLPALPDWFKERLVALAQLLARLRAKVDREPLGDRDVKYRPFHEGGMRVIKQLAKLGQMLAIVYDSEIDGQIARIIERTAFHTMIGFHVDIIRGIMLNGTNGSSSKELAARTGIPYASLIRRLDDLELMKVIVRGRIDPDELPYGHRGPTPSLWQVSPTIVDLWIRSRKEDK